MNKHIKIIVISLFILLGISLLCYGAFFHHVNISAMQDDKETELYKSEPELINLASIGGMKRDESGKINQTFAVGAKPPSTCPT